MTVTDHPFEPMPGWPDSCNHQHEGYDGWACLYLAEDHADPDSKDLERQAAPDPG